MGSSYIKRSVGFFFFLPEFSGTQCPTPLGKKKGEPHNGYNYDGSFAPPPEWMRRGHFPRGLRHLAPPTSEGLQLSSPSEQMVQT